MSINGLGVVNIDFNQQVDNNSTGKASPAKSQAQVKTGGEDTTSFTSDPQTVKTLSAAALVPATSRQARVDALKQAVDSAQYQVDSDKISESLANADV